MQPKLLHLSKEEIDQLIQRYYNGEKVGDLIAAFKIEIKHAMLNKLFPPTICETLYCPYCENVNLVSLYESRNSPSIKSKPLCRQCKHIADRYCQCDNCMQNEHSQKKGVRDRQRELIIASCSSVVIPPPVKELPFDVAVYLMSLTRHSITEDLKFAFLFDNVNIKLAPTFDLVKQMKSSLKEYGIISISTDSPVEAFIYNEDITSITAYYPQDILWEFLSSFSVERKKVYISELQELATSNVWPERWHAESKRLWKAIALSECKEYLHYLLESRNFSEIEIGEKTITAFEGLFRDFSISQIFNLSWQSVRDTVDFLSQKRIPQSQVANVFTSTLLRKRDRVLAQGWIVRDSRRDFNCPQSIVSATVFNLFLKLGDTALTIRIPSDNC